MEGKIRVNGVFHPQIVVVLISEAYLYYFELVDSRFRATIRVEHFGVSVFNLLLLTSCCDIPNFNFLLPKGKFKIELRCLHPL